MPPLFDPKVPLITRMRPAHNDLPCGMIYISFNIFHIILLPPLQTLLSCLGTRTSTAWYKATQREGSEKLKGTTRVPNLPLQSGRFGWESSTSPSTEPIMEQATSH